MRINARLRCTICVIKERTVVIFLYLHFFGRFDTFRSIVERSPLFPSAIYIPFIPFLTFSPPDLALRIFAFRYFPEFKLLFI